jgi:hypothetical protein
MQKMKVEADDEEKIRCCLQTWKLLSLGERLEATSGSISALTMTFDFNEIGIALQINVQIK